MSASVIRFGQWGKAMSATSPGNMKDAIQTVGHKVLLEMAEETKDGIQKAIRSGEAGGPALSPRTVAKKGSGTKLFETGMLAGLVEVREQGSTEITAGLHGDRPHRRVNVATLMAFLEKGTSTIPPRPVIEPTVVKLMPKLNRMATDSKIGKMIWVQL